MKHENADSARLRPCAKRLYTNVRLAKLNASITMECRSAICKQWYARDQSSLQKSFFAAMCWAASIWVQTG